MTPVHDSEALVIWIANKSRGSIYELKQCIRWMTRCDNFEDSFVWSLINGLENLGFIRRTPTNDGWEAIGRQLVIIPGRDGLALLTGCFNRELASQEDDDHGFWSTYVPASTDSQIARFLPKTMYVEAPEVQGYVDYQRDTGCGFVDVEMELSLLSANEGLHLNKIAAPPRYDTGTLERFELENLSYKTNLHGDSNGLYKQRVNGLLKYWIQSNGTWYETDRGTGPWLWRSISGENHEKRRLVWHSAKTESLYFNRKIALPAKLEQLLTLCSGLLPIEEPNARRFDNVSSHLSRIVFEYLKLDPEKGI